MKKAVYETKMFPSSGYSSIYHSKQNKNRKEKVIIWKT